MKLPRYLSIRAAARLAGLNKDTMTRRIRTLERAAKDGIMSVSPAHGRNMVNVWNLIRLQPDFFEQHIVTKQEFDELEDTVSYLSGEIQKLRTAVGRLKAVEKACVVRDLDS